MSKQTINVGATANDKKGDSLRAAFQKVNTNFTELYTALGLDSGGLNLGAFEFSGSTISTADSTSITIDQATTVTSDLTVGGDIVPSVANGGNLGSAARPWRSLYVSNNTVFLGGVPIGLEAGTNELKINNVPISQTINYADIPNIPTDISDLTDTGNLLAGGGGSTAWADITGKPTFSTVAISGSYNDLTDKPNIAGTYQFSVAADDSTQRLISSDEVIKFIGAGSVTTSSDAEGNITITGSTIVTGIESETDVSIKVNLTDSTQRVWRFSEDGDLEFPGATASIYGDANTLELFADTNSNNGIGISSSQTNVVNTGSVRIISDTDGNEHTWQFGADGTLTLPGTGTIRTAFGAMSINAPSGNSNLSIKSNDQTTYMIVGNGSAGITAGAYNWGFSNTGNLTFPDSTVQTTAWAGNFGYLTAEKDTIKGTAGYQYTFNTDGYFTGSTSSESTNYFFVTYNATNANIAAGWTVVGANCNTTVSSVVYPVAGYPNVIRVNLTAAASSTVGFYPVTVTSPDRLQVEIQPNPNNASKYTFTAAGITFPDNTVQTTAWTGAADTARNIESETDVSIKVNLTDSTQRIWRFGEDGKLTFPDGANYAGQTVTMPTTPNSITNSFVWEFSDQLVGSDTITLNWNLLASNQGSFYFGTTHSTNGKYLVLDGNNQSLGYIAEVGIDGGGRILFGATAGNNAGDANAIEIKATNGDVYVTSTESVRITVDAADSSARIWTFDPTGDLTFPDNTVQTTAYTGSTIATGIESESDVSIKVNLTDSTQRVWRFGEDGDLTLPNGQQIDATDADLLLIGTANAGLKLNSLGQSALLTAKKSFGRTFEDTVVGATFTAVPGDPPKIIVQLANNEGAYLRELLRRLETKLFEEDDDFPYAYNNITITLRPDNENITANVILVEQSNSDPLEYEITIDQDPTSVVENLDVILFSYDYENTIGVDVDRDIFGIATDNDDIDIISGRDIDLRAGDDISILANSIFDLTLVRNDYQIDTDGIQINTEDPNGVGSYSWKFQFDGNLSVPGAIISSGENDLELKATNSVKITVDAADSSARIWTFDPTGTLNLPGAVIFPANVSTSGPTIETVTVVNAGTNYQGITITPDPDFDVGQGLRIYPTQSEEGHLHVTANDPENVDLFLGTDYQYVKIAASGDIRMRARRGENADGLGEPATSGGSVTIEAWDAGNNDGDPATGAVGGNVYIKSGQGTLAGHTGGNVWLQTALGEEGYGSVYISTDGTNANWTFDKNGRTRFPTATAPAHSYGAAGDVAGMVAFDSSYIYYCTANFVNNSTNIWKRVALDATPW